MKQKKGITQKIKLYKILRKTKKRVKNKNKNKNKNKSKNQKGGVKIGEGGFGCVVAPHIPCSNKLNKSEKTYITKLINSDNESYLDELKLYNVIKKIDPKQKYLVSYVDTCELDNISINTRQENDIIKVNFTDKNKTSSDDNYTILDKNIEVTENDKGNLCLYDPSLKYFNQIQLYAGKELHSYLKINKNTNTYRLIKNNFRQICKHLLLGLKLLHQNKIVHRDIKPSNILIDIKNNVNITPRHIDFGLSTNLNKNYGTEDIGSRQGTAKYISLDIYIAYRIIKLLHKKIDVFTEKGFQTLLNDITQAYNTKYKHAYNKDKLNKTFLRFKSSKDNDIINTKEYVNIDDIKKLTIKLLKQYAKGTMLSNHKRIYDGYLYKSDIFALGLTFKKFYDTYEINNNRMENLIKHMLVPDPDKRFNINQCLRHIAFKKQNTKKHK